MVEVEELIKKKIGEGNQEFQKFNKFRFKPERYYLLTAQIRHLKIYTQDISDIKSEI